MPEKIEQIKQVITCLDDKLAIDLVTNINRSKDLVKTQQSTNFFNRFFQYSNGSNQRNQTLVNESLNGSVEGLLELIKKVVDNSNLGNKTILTITNELNSITNNLNEIAVHAIDTRIKLDELKCSVNKRFDFLEKEIKRIDLENKARVELDRLFNRWQVGKYNDLSILGRVCLVLETLKWGAFGELLENSTIKEYDSLIEELKDRLAVRISADINTNPETRLPKDIWLSYGNKEYMDAISYLCDWVDIKKHPLTYAVTQIEEKTSLKVPEFFNAIKVSNILIHENFIGNNK